MYGIISIKGKIKKDNMHSILSNMDIDLIPDDISGYTVYISDNAYFGIGGLRQPIFNEDHSLLIGFDGIIYNYKSLKEKLQEKGHIFFTQVDSEVVLHCFEQYGVDGFKRLRGKYSFVIYDLSKSKAIIVRDLAGEKPLYYYQGDDIFLFSSDLKSIINCKLVKKDIDKKALNQYLQLTYIPGPLTIYNRVYKLLPGHYLNIIRDNISIQQYWDVEYREAELILDYDKCKELLRETLYNAVEECMSTNQSIGIFLSGGIDSTIITGIASKISNRSLDSFTIGYKDKRYDESERAKLASSFHKTREHIFNLDYEDVLPDLNRIMSNLDEPYADPSYIPSYIVSKYAKEFVDIVLTGDCGDELFGGYSKYLIGYYSEQYNRIPRWAREIFKKAVYAIPDKTPISRKVRKVIENSENDIFTQRKNLMLLGFKQEELPLLLKDSYKEDNTLNFIESHYNSQINSDDELSKALYTDFKVVLEGDMLPKVRIASRLASLETRSPILYKDVVELAAKIPNRYKINTKNRKIIFKDTFKDLIPKELLTAGKMGFGVPIGDWFRAELKNDLLNELNKDRINDQGIFNYNYIEKVLNDHFIMTRDRSRDLWILYVFQKWYRSIYQ